MEDDSKLDDREEDNAPPSESSSWLSPSSWFQSRDKKSTEWKPGQYDRPFFSKFDPKKVFDKRTKESKHLRKYMIIQLVERDFKIDEKAPYFKDLILVKSSRNDINLEYKGRPIAIYSTKHENVKGTRNKALFDFKLEIDKWHKVRATKELKPQIQEEILEEDLFPYVEPESEYSFEQEMRDLEELRINPDEEYNRKMKEAEKRRQEDTSFFSAFKSAGSITKNVAVGLTKIIKTASNVEGDPTETVVQDIKTTAQIKSGILDLEFQKLQIEYETYKEEAIQRQHNIETHYINQIADLNRKIEKNNNPQLRKDLESATNELNRVRAVSRQVIEKGDSLLSEKESKILQLQESIELKSSQILDKESEIDHLKSQLKSLQDYVDSNADEADSLALQIKDLKQKLKTVENEKKTLKDLYDKQTNEIEELKNQVPVKIEEALSSLRSQLQKETNSNKDLTEMQSSLKVKIGPLEENVKALEINYVSEKTYSSDLKKNRDTLQEQINDRKAAYENDVKNYSKRIKQLNKEIDDLKDKVKENDRYKSDYEKFIKEKEDEIVLTTSQLRSSETQYKSLLQELQNQRVSFDKLEKEKLSIQNDYKFLLEKYQRLDETFEDIKKSASEDFSKNRLAKKELQDQVDSLSSSIQTYKDSLDALVEKNKLDIKKLQDSLQAENTKVKDLQDKLSKSQISEKNYKKLFNESENKLKLDSNRLKNLISTKENSLSEILREKEILTERVSILEKDVTHYKDRVAVKDNEINDYLKTIKDLKDQIEKLTNSISKNDFYKEQFNKLKLKFDRLTLEHNDLVHKANQTMLDKTELEVEFDKNRKELEETKTYVEDLRKKIIDPLLIREYENNIRTLNEKLTNEERKTIAVKKEKKDLQDEIENLNDAIRKIKNDNEDALAHQKDLYETKLEKQKKDLGFKLKNQLRPGELKAIGILLDKVNIDDYENVDYDKAIKDFRTARDKFKKVAEDPESPHGMKLLFDNLRKTMDVRIDIFNIEHGKPVETPYGDNLLRQTKRGLQGAFYKFKMTLISALKKATLVSVLGGIIYGVSSFVTMTIASTAKGAAKTIVVVTKTIAPTIKDLAPKAAVLAIAGGVLATKTFLWVADHVYSIIVGGISVSILLYKNYGEEAIFPILAFWSLVLAYGLIVVNKAYKLRNYFQ